LPRIEPRAYNKTALSNDPSLRIVPLGGLGRVGGNMMAYETDDVIVVVDCGVLFPTVEQPGVDYVIPDVTYLAERRDKVRGYILTHGHEDHLGALPYVLPQVPAPVFGTAFTLALLGGKLAEFPGLAVELHEIVDREPFEVGGLRVEPVPVTHSIPGAVSLVLHTPVGRVVHTGDFKLDPDPIDGRLTDLAMLQAAGDAGVAALLSDSTNADRGGHTWSEREVGMALEEQVCVAPERVIVTTFASNIHRLQLIFDASVKAGRQIMPVGRSMQQNVQMGLERGFLRAPAGTVVDASQFARIDRRDLTVIASGSQGEPRSAMSRIAAGLHSQIQIEPGDRVIFSARRIPGNERAIGMMINHLVKLGAEVIDDRIAKVHTSGHAFNDEQRRMLELCRPEIFIPVHGEYRHLARHAALAHKLGWDKDRILVTEDGGPIDLTRSNGKLEARRVEPVQAGHVFVDGTGIGDVGEVVLRDRRVLAETGMVICVVIFSEDGEVVGGPDIVTRGVVHVDTSQELLGRAVEEVRTALEALGPIAETGERADVVRQSLRRFFKRERARRPIILPVVMEV